MKVCLKIQKWKRVLVDKYNRVVDYLRIGVTDKCNLRCRYCMPAEGIDFSKREDLLSYEEILRLATIFASMGVTKVRLTGGEPFIRKDLDRLLIELAGIFPQVHITTNATLLTEYLPLIKSIGITGLNISLDTLDKDKFLMITRRDQFDEVVSTIYRCQELGIPIKINVVVMKGVNDMEIPNILKWGIEKGIEVRFIEPMPFNEWDGNKKLFISAEEILAIIRSNFEAVNFIPTQINSSSNKYIISNIDKNPYKFGIIPAYSRSLCGSCNRIRLTPKGELLNCLYSEKGIELLPFVRDKNVSDEQLALTIKNSIYQKLKNGHEEEAIRGAEVFRSMTTIGG